MLPRCPSSVFASRMANERRWLFLLEARRRQSAATPLHIFVWFCQLFPSASSVYILRALTTSALDAFDRPPLPGPRKRFAMTGAASAALCAAIVALALVLPAQGAPEGRLLPPTPQPRSFHIVIPTIGRRELLRMLDSVVPQLDSRDFLTVVFDGKDVDDSLSSVRARVGQTNATVKLLRRRRHNNVYGEAVRQACKKLPGDFVVFADDDDFFVPDALNTYRATCNDTSRLYIFQMVRLFDGVKLWSAPTVTWANIGSPMGVIPSWLNDLGTWPDKHGGDFDYYKSLLPHLSAPPEFVERVTYLVTSHSLEATSTTVAAPLGEMHAKRPEFKRVMRRPHTRHPAPATAHSLAADLTVADLPMPAQLSKRLLVSIIVGDASRPRLLARVLDSLVHVCEAGYEVHVVLMVQQPWAVNDAELYSKSRFLCFRTGADLPVVTQLHTHHGPPMSTPLSSLHRRLFVDMMDRYDLFLSQEDDMLVQARHVAYFAKWAHQFRGTDLYPGFAVSEVATPLFNVSQLYSRAPLVWNPHTGGNLRRAHVFNHSGTLVLMHAKAWAPLYFLTRDMLAQVSSYPAWLDDASKPWIEFNAHFQHLWLPRYVRVVVPVDDVRDSFVLRMPDNYIAAALEQKPAEGQHNHAVEVDEFAAALHGCLGGAGTSSWDVSGLQYDVVTTGECDGGLGGGPLPPCGACVLAGSVARVEFEFAGAFPAEAGQKSSQPLARVCCTDATKALPRQEVAGCVGEQWRLRCEQAR